MDWTTTQWVINTGIAVLSLVVGYATYVVTVRHIKRQRMKEGGELFTWDEVRNAALELPEARGLREAGTGKPDLADETRSKTAVTAANGGYFADAIKTATTIRNSQLRNQTLGQIAQKAANGGYHGDAHKATELMSG